MSDLNLQLFSDDENAEAESLFDSIKHVNDVGQEFWYARELSKILNYKDFRNYESTIYKAMEACKNSGNEYQTISVKPPRWSLLALVQTVLFQVMFWRCLLSYRYER